MAKNWVNSLQSSHAKPLSYREIYEEYVDSIAETFGIDLEAQSTNDDWKNATEEMRGVLHGYLADWLISAARKEFNFRPDPKSMDEAQNEIAEGLYDMRPDNGMNWKKSLGYQPSILIGVDESIDSVKTRLKICFSDVQERLAGRGTSSPSLP